VQLQEGVVVRRVGQRKAAALAILEQDVDVLAGQKPQPFAHRQLEIDDHDIVGRVLDFLHARRHAADRNILCRADLAAFDFEIAQWSRLAEQRTADRLFGIRQHVLLVIAIIHASGQDFSLAAAAGAVAAAVGNDQPFAQCGLEDGFVVVNRKAVVAGFDRDVE
jgi:hypothetical protein